MQRTVGCLCRQVQTTAGDRGSTAQKARVHDRVQGEQRKTRGSAEWNENKSVSHRLSARRRTICTKLEQATFPTILCPPHCHPRPRRSFSLPISLSRTHLCSLPSISPQLHPSHFHVNGEHLVVSRQGFSCPVNRITTVGRLEVSTPVAGFQLSNCTVAHRPLGLFNVISRSTSCPYDTATVLRG